MFLFFYRIPSRCQLRKWSKGRHVDVRTPRRSTMNTTFPHWVRTCYVPQSMWFKKQTKKKKAKKKSPTMPSSVVPRISYYYLYYYYCCYYYLPLLLQQGLYSPTSSRIDNKFINAFQYALAELIYLLKTQTHTHIYGKKKKRDKNTDKVRSKQKEERIR